MLSSCVCDRDLAVGVNGNDAAIHRAEDVLDVLVGQDHLTVELRVVHRDRGLVCKGSEQLDVIGEVGVSRELRAREKETD